MIASAFSYDKLKAVVVEHHGLEGVWENYWRVLIISSGAQGET